MTESKDSMTYGHLVPRAEPSVSEALERLGARIRRSSNFRFAWQFFTFEGFDSSSPEGARAILQKIIAVEECHRFLRDSDVALGDTRFEIEPIHQHCRVVEAEGEFERTLAGAAFDHLGAYSYDSREATPWEVEQVRPVLAPLGPYRAFQLLPGNTPGCSECAYYNNHIFSSWFYGVAWDWCFVLSWPKEHRAWIGCLSDTD